MPGQRFAPTTLGLGLVDAYISMGLELSKPRLRAEVKFQRNFVGVNKKDGGRYG